MFRPNVREVRHEGPSAHSPLLAGPVVYPLVRRCYGSGEVSQPVGPQDSVTGEPQDVATRTCKGCRDCRVGALEQATSRARRYYRDEAA